MMPGFAFSRFRFTLTLTGSGTLPPYKGSLLRGAFGHALRELVCDRAERHCDACARNQQCDFTQMFKPNNENGRSIPAPYVIDPPALKKTEFAAGDSFSFTLTLFGTAMNSFQTWCRAIEHCGARFGLGSGRIPFTVGGVDIVNGEVPEPEFSAPERTLGVRLLTPLKIKSGGEFSCQLSTDLFMQAIMRRLKALAASYCPEDPTFDFSPHAPHAVMSHPDLKWVTLERSSMNHPGALNIGGLVGSFTLSSVSPAAYYLLQLGEIIHIGKNTVYGCGKYRLSVTA